MFTSPTAFPDAIRALTRKGALPTTLSSAELDQLPAAIRQQAMFSARVSDARHLSMLDRLLAQMVDPGSRQTGPTGQTGPTPPGAYMNEPLARKLIRQFLADTGYAPAEGEAGTLKDLSSEARIRLQIQTNLGLSFGYGLWRQGQDDDVLNEFPAQRLLPSVSAQPRSQAFWRQRWTDAGLPMPQGQLVALKTDPGWARLSRFGVPYPPFDYGSTRDVEDVDRDEAESLGLIDPAARLQGSREPFAPPLQAPLPSPAPGGESLLSAILQAFPGAKFNDGILTSL
jgi:hypothetical protein